MQHDALSSILVLVFSLIPPDYKEWPSMPSSTAGFQSHILNPTNQHSLVSQLPIPSVYMLLHTNLMLTADFERLQRMFVITKINRCTTCTFAVNSTVSKRHDANLLSTTPPIRITKCLVSLGLVLWLDGLDPSASSKNNRSPIHTASVTLLCIDNLTGVLFNARTFPFACGPGKADQNIIFQALRHSLDKVQASEDTVWSDHHGCWTALRAHVIVFLMDQPEQRGTNFLLGGNQNST
jgi:hypothetical protein